MSDIPNLRSKIRVSFVNAQGVREEGADGGGLYKEFLNSLIQIVFNPNYGLFVLTQTGKELYPNAKSKSLFKDDIHIYKFLGRILGKAIYDGITVEPQFANFFLKKLIGKQNNLNDLKSLDPDLHKNLNFIKEYEGSVEDLSLTF